MNKFQKSVCNTDALLLQTASEQSAVSHQDIPVQYSVTVPIAVGGFQHMPVNNSVNECSLTLLTSPSLPTNIDPFISLLPVHQDFVANRETIPTSSCEAMIPEVVISHHTERSIQNRHAAVDDDISGIQMNERLKELPRCERVANNHLSDPLDDILYKDRILDDDISRELLEKRRMKEKIEQWKIQDGVDSDKVEFARLRTPHRSVIHAGILFFALFLLLMYL